MLDRVPIALLAGVVGWCLGWASAWLTDWLQTGEDAADKVAAPGMRGLLIRDPIVQAAAALVWAALPFFRAGEWWRWAEAGLLAVPLIQVAVTDFRTRYVYTVVAAIGLLLGLAFGWQVHTGSDSVPALLGLLFGWQLHGLDFLASIAGAVGGFVAFTILWILGRVLYRGVEAMARGDITIAAMVGAGSAACTPQALFVGVLVGGVLAVGVLLVRRSRHEFMPYGPGLCLGGLVTLFWC